MTVCRQSVSLSGVKLAVLALKGGVGKTTTSMATALTLASDGASVLLVDADEDQQSATAWRDLAVDAGEKWPATLDVRAWSSRLTGSVFDQYDHVVVDLGPKRRELARSVLRLVDTVVIPTPPRRADFSELYPAVELVKAAAERHPMSWGVLLTMLRRTTKAAREARAELLGALDLPVMVAEVGLAERYSDMFGQVPADVGEYRAVVAELLAGSPTEEGSDVTHA